MRIIFCCFVAAAGCSGSGLNGGNNDAGTDAAATGADLAASTDDLAGMGGMACNPVTQDCPDPTLPRCAVVVQMMMVSAQCVADGTAARDATCTVDMTTGIDNCVKGTLCTGRTLPMGMSACRKYCAASADCGAGQKCRRLTATIGECLPTCTEFGTGCGTGRTCAGPQTEIGGASPATSTQFLTCRAVGAVMAGDNCMRSTDCSANMLCVGGGGGQGFCSPLCDTGAHATCPTLPNGMADGGGTALSCMLARGLLVCQ